MPPRPECKSRCNSCAEWNRPRRDQCRSQCSADDVKAQRDVRRTVTHPFQRRGLEHQVFHKSGWNAKIIVGLAELLLCLENYGGREIAFLQPCIANGCNRRVEVMITIVQGMERENVPPCDISCAKHSLPDGP